VAIVLLALLGIVDARFLIQHIRYAVLGIFVVAAVICPTPDVVGMCVFASPMLVLYMLGVVAAQAVDLSRHRMEQGLVF
jgi:sec-independent protein translocase protein TatC